MSEPADDPRVTEYQATVAMLYGWAAVLADVDIPGLLAGLQQGHALGPIVDPTLYRRKMAAMREDQQVLEAAQRLRLIGLELQKQASSRRDH